MQLPTGEEPPTYSCLCLTCYDDIQTESVTYKTSFYDSSPKARPYPRARTKVEGRAYWTPKYRHEVGEGPPRSADIWQAGGTHIFLSEPKANLEK